MIQRKKSSSSQGMLLRPRLHSLISEGLQHPLLVMLAGPGYGKTQAMAGYLAEAEADGLWIRLTGLDNLPSHFWSHLVQVLQPEHSELAHRLSTLGFPETLAGFDAFVRLLSHNQHDKLILVFDDFQVISDERIRLFFRMLVEMELKQFPVVLISSELANPESVAFMSRKRFPILGKDLRFTREEISELYGMYDLPLEPDELANIERHTEGWALALHLLVQQRNKSPNMRFADEVNIAHLFEERFFSAYSGRQQRLLAGLSLLNYFTRELAEDLSGGGRAEVEELAKHPFLISEPVTGRLFWHHLYRLFLQRKLYLLTEADELLTYKTAAEHYVAADDAMEAISCFRKCGDHVNMLQAMALYAKNLRNIVEREAGFLLEHLDLLSPQLVLEHPVADYLRAHIHMNLLELETAETLLVNLEKRLLAADTPQEVTLLGNVYVSLGFVHMMRNQEDYGLFFQKADRCLPQGSSFYDRNCLALENNNCFALADNLPGARERMEAAAFKWAPWLNKVLRGCMSGMEHIISAESAFMICDLEKARQQAYLGLYKAEANGQHDYALNGYFVLVRTAFLEGDLTEMTKQRQSIVEYAAKYKIAVLDEIRDTILTWYYLKLQDFSRIPKSILTTDYSNLPLTAHGRLQIAHAGYLAAKEEYAKLIGLLEHPQGLFLSGGFWMDRISLMILRAIGHHRLGNIEAGMSAFWEAYDMCYHNKLTALFIETGDYLLPLICQARQQRQYEFDRVWLDSIYDQSNSCVQRMKVLRAEYQKLNPAKTDLDNPLSKRERAVLQTLSQGLTREEIALKQYISVNTVKAAIRSIYNKLNANNRAEAVSIAIARGYIEGYARD